ncbi:hypothetical protein ACFL2R_00380 [Patescibacteria group bacterium]
MSVIGRLDLLILDRVEEWSQRSQKNNRDNFWWAYVCIVIAAVAAIIGGVIRDASVMSAPSFTVNMAMCTVMYIVIGFLVIRMIFNQKEEVYRKKGVNEFRNNYFRQMRILAIIVPFGQLVYLAVTGFCLWQLFACIGLCAWTIATYLISCTPRFDLEG